MDMKKKYVSAEIEIINLKATDIITVSKDPFEGEEI